WTTLRLMTEVRSHPAYCVFDRKLYIFGGTGDYFHHFQSCEYYDPDTDSWTPIRPMKDGRTAAAAAVLNRQIYVVGGYDGDSDLDRLERYDPVSDTWTTLRSMTLKRAGCRLVTSCGKLFVSGGFLDFSDYIFSMEMYDPETDTWEEATTLSVYIVTHLILSVPSTYLINFQIFQTVFSSSHSNGFSSFLLNEELQKAISECSFNYPSRVQNEVIPQIMHGLDVYCEAKSETGKTTAFVTGTLQQLEQIDGQVSVLVLCRSHDVATKIHQEYEKLAKHLSNTKLSDRCSDDRLKNNQDVLINNRPNIVVGTPG
ncbi:hypothetical protein PENTCL1PPCAC_20718, partial [Pristionchus entomophagus]